MGCSIASIKAPERVVTADMEERIRLSYRTKFDRNFPGPTAESSVLDAVGRAQGTPEAKGKNGDPEVTKHSAGSDGDPTQAKLFLREGMRLADLKCQRYFDALGQAARQFNFGRKEVGLLGAATAAIQGLTGVASKDIALTAAMVGLTGGSLDNFGDVFLFSPDINAVRVMVTTAKQTYAQAIPSEDIDMVAAVQYLTEYETYCTVDSIRGQVNSSVAGSNPVVTFAGTPIATDAVNTVVKPLLRAVLSNHAVKDEELPFLYWLTQAKDDAERAYIAARLPEVKVVAESKGKLPADTLAQVKAAFLALPADQKKKLDENVVLLKAAYAKAAPAVPETGATTPPVTPPSTSSGGLPTNLIREFRTTTQINPLPQLQYNKK